MATVLLCFHVKLNFCIMFSQCISNMVLSALCNGRLIDAECWRDGESVSGIRGGKRREDKERGRSERGRGARKRLARGEKEGRKEELMANRRI